MVRKQFRKILNPKSIVFGRNDMHEIHVMNQIISTPLHGRSKVASMISHIIYAEDLGARTGGHTINMRQRHSISIQNIHPGNCEVDHGYILERHALHHFHQHTHARLAAARVNASFLGCELPKSAGNMQQALGDRFVKFQCRQQRINARFSQVFPGVSTVASCDDNSYENGCHGADGLNPCSPCFAGPTCPAMHAVPDVFKSVHLVPASILKIGSYPANWAVSA